MNRAKKGHTVKFHGLQGAAHLNDTLGTLVEYYKKGRSAGRWAVRCESNDELVTAKPQNLKLINKSTGKDPLLKDSHPDYVAALKRGYEWHVQDNGENAMEWKDWLHMAFAINKNFDEKIKYYHGFVHWVNGNRNFNGMLNIQFWHVCDILVTMHLPTVSLVTNMEDGLTKDQVAFVRDNFDYFWVGYHDTNSNIAIKMAPRMGKRTMSLFQAESFQKEQAEKLKKTDEMMDYMFWICHQKGLYRVEASDGDTGHVRVEGGGNLVGVMSGTVIQPHELADTLGNMDDL